MAETENKKNKDKIRREVGLALTRSKAKLDTFESDLDSFISDYNKLDGWRDAETMARYTTSARNMLNRANAYKNYYAGKDENYDSAWIDNVISGLSGASDYISERAGVYAGFTDAAAYNAKVKTYADNEALWSNKSSDEILGEMNAWRTERDSQNAAIDEEIAKYSAEWSAIKQKIARAKRGDIGQAALAQGQDYYKGLNNELDELTKKISELEASKVKGENTAGQYYYYKKLFDELGADGYLEGYVPDKEEEPRNYESNNMDWLAWALGASEDEIKAKSEFLKLNYGYDLAETGYNELTDREKALYFAIRDKLGDDALAEYVDYLYNTNSDYNMALAARIGRTSNERKSDFERIVGSVGTGLESWAMGNVRALNSLMSDKAIPTQPFEYESGYAREALSDSMIKQGLYDIGVSFGQMAPSILATTLTGNLLGAAGIGGTAAKVATSAVSSATFGTAIYGNAYNEALLAGTDKSSALAYGALTAASEVALQHVLGGIPGIGQHLTGDFVAKLANRTSNVLLKVAVQIGGDAIGEFTEEYLQEILGQVFRNICLGEDGEVKLFSEEALYSGIIGALTSAGMNIPAQSIGYVKQNNLGKLYNTDAKYDEISGAAALIEEGLAASADSEAFKYAEILSKRQSEGKNITNAQLGYLAVKINEASNNNKGEADTEKSQNIGEKPIEGMRFTFDNTIPYTDLTVSQGLIDFADSVLSMQDKSKISKRKYKMGAVSNKHAEIIKKATGLDIAGYEVWIDGNAIQHINERHGENGETDHSMQSKEDIGRLLWIVNNADGGNLLYEDDGSLDLDSTYTNSDQSPFQKVLLYKKYSNNTYLVAECVPDNVTKKLIVKSAYKKSGNGQEMNMQTLAGSPHPTSETLLDYPAANNSIPYSNEFVKGFFENNYSPDKYIPELWEAAGGTRTAQDGAESTETGKRTLEVKNAAEGENEAVREGNAVQIEGEPDESSNDIDDEYADDKKKLARSVKSLGKGTRIAEMYNSENDSKGRTEKQNMGVYINDYKIVRTISANGHSLDAIEKMDIKGSLTSAQFVAAFEEGRAEAVKDGKLIEAEGSIAEGAPRRSGKLYYNGMRGVKSKRSSLFLPQSGINANWKRNYSLSSDQRVALRFIEDVLGPMGVDVVLYSSATNRTLPNGMYDGNRIYIDIEASMTERSRQTFVMYAIAHELTHMAERLSPELWSKYADAVIEIIAQEDGKTPAELIRERQVEHEQSEFERLSKVYHGEDETYVRSKIKPLDEAGAIKEIVADASQLILTRSSNFAEKLKTKDEGLCKKIIALVKKAIKKMQEILGGLDTPDDGVSAAVEKHLDELTEYFDNMLADTIYKAGYTNETELTDIGEMQYQDRAFAEQVDKILKNDFPRGNQVRVTKTPSIYQNIGMNPTLPMLMSATHIYNACQEKNRDTHQHGLKPEQIKKLPEELRNPVMIVDALDKEGNIIEDNVIVVTGMLDPDNVPVIVPIRVNGDGQYDDIEVKTNYIKSTYGKESFSFWLKNHIDTDTILYINKEKAEQLATESNSQWFEQLKSYSFNTIIHKSRAIVNPFSENSNNFQNQNRRMVGETDRAVLSKALMEGSVASEEEFILLEEYREDLASYNEMEREITALTAEINRLKSSSENEQHKDKKLEEAYARRKELKDTLTKIDSKLLNIEAMSPMRRLIALERDKTKAAKQKLAHTRESYDNSLKKRQQKMREKQLEQERKRQERNMRAMYLARAERALSRIYRRLANPTKNDHIPSELLPFVKTLFDTIDVSHHFAEIEKLEEKLSIQQARINELMANGAESSIIKAQEDYAADLLARIRKLEGVAHNISWKERMETLTKMISKVEEVQNTSGIYADFAPGLVGDIQKALDNFTDQPGVTRLFDAEPLQLRFYAEALESISHSIIEAGRLYSNSRANNTQAIGEQSIIQFKQEKREEAKSKALAQPRHMYGIDSLNPAYFGHKLGAATESVINELFEGFYSTIGNVRVIDEFSEKLREKYHISDFTGKNEKVHDIVLEGGGHVRMTTAQLMTVYALHDRPQAQKHLYGKGIKVFKGDLNEAIEKTSSLKERTVDEAKRIFAKNTDKINENLQKLLGGLGVHEVTRADVDAMIGELKAGQIECVKEMKKFLKDVIAPMGNKTSQTLYLYDMFTEANYFPIESDKTFIRLNEKDSKDGDISARSVFSILNKGFTKQVQENAVNPIIIRDIFDVFMEHCFDMANYGGLGVAVSDTIKWLNYKNGETSVRAELEEAYGKTAEKYIRNLLMSIEGELKGTDGAKLINKLMRNVKIASVAANLRVVLLQPTAYIRAAMVLSGKNLKRALGHKPMTKEAQAHSELMYYKMLGFYDMNTSSSLLEKVRGDQSTADKLREKSTWLAGKADELTWGCLWRACRYEVDDEIRASKLNIAKESPEYFTKVRDKFHEVINFTQVIDTPMHKNKLMSDPDTGMKQLTAFMAEPMLTYDMLMSAVDDCKRKRAGSGKKLRRALVVYSIQVALQAVFGGIADAARDDDEDEHWFEKYYEAVIKNMTGIDIDSPAFGEILAGDWNPLNNIPIIKEVFSLLEGYEPTRMDLQGIAKVVQAANKFQKIITDGGEFDYKAFYSLCQAISQVLGIPISNIIRLVKSAYNIFISWFGLN